MIQIYYDLIGGPDQVNKICADPVNALLRLIPWGGTAALVKSSQLDSLQLKCRFILFISSY